MNRTKNYLIKIFVLWACIAPTLLFAAPPKWWWWPFKPKPPKTELSATPKGGDSGNASPKGGSNSGAGTVGISGRRGDLPTDIAGIEARIQSLLPPPPSQVSAQTWPNFTINGAIDLPSLVNLLRDPKIDIGGRPQGPILSMPTVGFYEFGGIEPHLHPLILAMIRKYGFHTDIPIIVTEPGVIAGALGSYIPPSTAHPRGLIKLGAMALTPPKKSQYISLVDIALFHELMHHNIHKLFPRNKNMSLELYKLYQEMEIRYREFLLFKLNLHDITTDLPNEWDNFRFLLDMEAAGSQFLKKGIVGTIIYDYLPYFPDEYHQYLLSDAFLQQILDSKPPGFVTIPW